jgi:hypothetical protein
MAAVSSWPSHPSESTVVRDRVASRGIFSGGIRPRA